MVFHYKPCWGTPIFGNTHIPIRSPILQVGIRNLSFHSPEREPIVSDSRGGKPGRYATRLRIVELEIEGHHSGAHLGLSEDPGDDLYRLEGAPVSFLGDEFFIGKTCI